MGKSTVEDKYLRRKINLLTAIIIVFVFIVFIFTLIFIKYDNNREGKANILRVESAYTKEVVKEMYSKNKYYINDEIYDFTLINLKGEVLFSSNNQVAIGNKVDLEKEVGYDNSFNKNSNGIIQYSCPLVIDEIQQGTIIIYLPQSILQNNKMFNNYAMVWGILILIILISLRIRKFINVDIIKPIKEIDIGAKNILKGNYATTINYDYHGEVGRLCHDFEAMRDELKNSKAKEEELKRSEKELLACISHDLKTPLSSILGYVEGIKYGIVKNEEGIQRYCEIILRKSKELSKLIDDILEQSKTELNEMSINKKEIYSDEYFEEVLTELASDVTSNDMKLLINGEIPRVLIEIDPIRIKQAINNIITNSIKYSKSGEIIEFSIWDEGNKLFISIRDYGGGISQSDVPFVFNKFYRGEKYRDTTISGSGLGLSIVKYIIESHRGEIKCKSSSEGTTFTFSIPKY